MGQRTHILTIGSYEIHHEIGRGQISVVYEAYDTDSHETVAFKLLPRDLLEPGTRERYEATLEQVSTLDHPSLVRIHHYSHYQHQPFVVMDLMDGSPLADQIMLGPLSIMEAARYVGLIAEGLEVAHAAGIIHGDLNPHNILFDRSGRLGIADFGLAAFHRPFAEVASVPVTGSPGYVAPELGRQNGGTTQTDVYALGVLLYQMLTSHLPYEGDTPVEILRGHLQRPVPNVRSYRPDLPEGVQQVMLRAMAKDPYDRYQTARDLHQDLLHVMQAVGLTPVEEHVTPMYIAPPRVGPAQFGDDEYATVPEWLEVDELDLTTQPGTGIDILLDADTAPFIEADEITHPGRGALVEDLDLESAPPVQPAPEEEEKLSLLERRRRRAQERRALGNWRAAMARRAGASEAVARLAGFTIPPLLSYFLFALLVALLVVWVQLFIIPNFRQIDVAVRQVVAPNSIVPTATSFPTPTPIPVSTAMPTAVPAVIEIDAAHTGNVTALAFDPSGQYFASGGEDNRIVIWDITTGQQKFQLGGHTGTINALAYNADGSVLASASADDTVIIWDTATGAALQRLQTHSRPVNVVAWSPDGQTIASGADDGVVIVWNLDGTGIYTVSAWLDARSGPITALAFTSASTLIAGTGDAIITWDVPNAAQVSRFAIGTTVHQIITLTSSRFLFATDDGLYTFNASSGVLDTVESRVFLDAALSPDGDRVAGANAISALLVYDLTTRAPVREFDGMASAVRSVAWSPDGRYIVTGGLGGDITVWDTQLGSYQGVAGPVGTPVPLGAAITLETAPNVGQWVWLGGHTDLIRALSFNLDGSRLTSASQDGRLLMWDVATGQALPAVVDAGEWETGAAYDPQGVFLASSRDESYVVLRDPVTGEEQSRLEGAPDSHVSSLVWSPGGALIAAGLTFRDTHLNANVCTRQDPSLDANCACEGLDLVCRQGLVVAWDLDPQTGEVLGTHQFLQRDNGIVQVAFSADGVWMAVGRSGATGEVYLWDVASTSPVYNQPITVSSTIRALAWGPSRLLAIASDAGLDLWNVDTFALQTHVPGSGTESFTSAAWSPDASVLAAGSASGDIVLIDPNGVEAARLSPDQMLGGVTSLAFSPDGRLLAAGYRNGTIILWAVTNP